MTVLEAGIRNQRLDSILESDDGAIATGGTFIPFSNVVKKFTWTPDAGMDARRGIGSVDILDHDTGLETHSAVVTYLLQGTIAAGTPLYEAFTRDADGLLNSRTIVMREKHAAGGTAGNGIRTYVVLTGAKPASARVPGDPGTAGPIQVEITYTVQKGRQYEISQPSAADYLVLTSSEASDNGATVTVEDDAGVQESIVVGGTSTTQFSSIDAIELANELTGTLFVVEGTTGTGATLATVYGKNSYENAEGDLGVPVTPSGGTRITSLGDTYEKFLGDTITYAGGDLAFDINSVELSVDNSVEVRPRNNARTQRVIEGNRTLQLTATVLGEREYQNQITRHLQSQEANIVWTLTNTTITLEGAALTKVGDKTVETGQAYMEINDTFEGTAITFA